MTNKGRIYVVDDDTLIVSLVTRSRVKEGYEVRSSSDALSLEKDVAAFSPDLLLLDIGLPDRSGLDGLRGVKEANRDLPVVMLTADDGINTAIQAMKLGAADYLTKPFEMDRLKSVIDFIVEKGKLQRKVDYLARLSSPIFKEEFIGESPEILELKEKALKLAETKVSAILITGESGTGKELMAKHIHRVIHADEEMSDVPFVAINCAAIPEQLMESELFGHMKGSFTDAKEDKRGMFEMAHGGSLLLDEIGEMRSDLQSKMLRVLEERKVHRIGGKGDIHVDVTVIATTNVDISGNVRSGLFRSDLYYRLSTFEFHIPSLRERRGDIVPIASYFLDFFSDKYQKREVNGFTPEAEDVMTSYPWPGNVRELRNVMERIVVLESSDVITPDQLPRELLSQGEPGDQIEIPGYSLPEGGIDLEEVERELIVQALRRTGDNRVQAAKLLSLGYDALRYKIRKYGLE
jgi:DNA-binding NtrC family response regulator